MVIDICNAIPEVFKDESRWDKFQHIDMATFDIELNISGQKRRLRDIHSRIFYDFFVKGLQKLYSLQIKDDQKSFDYCEKEISEIFIRPRHTINPFKQTPRISIQAPAWSHLYKSATFKIWICWRQFMLIL